MLVDATEQKVPMIIHRETDKWNRMTQLRTKLLNIGYPFYQGNLHQQAQTHFLAHSTPQIYMNSRMINNLNAEDTAIIRSTTGVPVGSAHNFRYEEDATVTRT